MSKDKWMWVGAFTLAAIAIFAIGSIVGTKFGERRSGQSYRQQITNVEKELAEIRRGYLVLEEQLRGAREDLGIFTANLELARDINRELVESDRASRDSLGRISSILTGSGDIIQELIEYFTESED